jgi:2',3'-cyclic-nucleotide 2'-phosphodiesterase (5'-nucleotidase family)
MKKFLPQVKKHADVIIVLSHLGFPEDLKLAYLIGGIDVIVGGHSHTRVEKPRTVGSTIIVQAWEHGKTLGVLDLEVYDGRVALSEGHLEKILASGPRDEAVQELVKKYQTQVDEVLGQVIGETTVFLDGQNVRRRETNLGNWLADLIRQTANADVAVLNGGGIRRSLAAGPISLRDIQEIIPFENYIIALELTGRDIVQILEHGLSGLPAAAARFPQVSGIKVCYDLSAPPGRRLLEVQVGGQPLVDDKIYVLATVDFLAAGGDDYSMFPKIFCGVGETGQTGNNPAHNLVYNDTGRLLKQIVSDYIKTQKIISPEMEGRIVENN